MENDNQKIHPLRSQTSKLTPKPASTRLKIIKKTDKPAPKRKVVKPEPVEAPKPAPKRKKKQRTVEDYFNDARNSLENIKCNVLTGDCVNCNKLKECKEANGNFTQVSNALSYHLIKEMGHNALKLYLYLAARAGGNPKSGNFGKVWVSNPKISEDIGIGEAHINNHIAELKGYNLIKTYYEDKGKKQKKFKKQRFIYITYFAKLRDIQKVKGK